MNTVMTPNRRTKWLAGMAAALGTLLTIGGPLTLAEHYAQSGARWEASGYYATQQSRRITCSDNGNIRTADASPRRGAANS